VGLFSGGKGGSSGQHGGGHKDRDRGKNASDRKAAERQKQAKIAKSRGQRDKSGRKPKDKGSGNDDLNTL
jgi:hypothetical protein